VEIQIGLNALVLMVLLGVGAVVAFTIAVVNERRMQRHRRPGVSYAQVTFRRDGGWRRDDLFTETGLVFQRRAAQWGMIGAVCAMLVVIALMLDRIL
jgi:hypothetical protein